MFNKIIKSLFLFFLIFISYKIFQKENFYLLQNANLIFHEAGHTLLMFFGRFLYILGGTLGQLLFPTIFLIYFLRKTEFYSAALMLWWFGENLTEIAIYMSDARAQVLPLIGGEHDWANLFSMLKLLPYDTIIGDFTWWTGILFMIVGISFAAYSIIKK